MIVAATALRTRYILDSSLNINKCENSSKNCGCEQHYDENCRGIIH